MRRLLAILILLLPLAAIHAQDEVVNAMRHPISGGGANTFTILQTVTTSNTCSSCTSLTLTVPSTGSNHLLVLEVECNNGPTCDISSVSAGGTWTIDTNCHHTDGTIYGGVGCAYVPCSSTSGVTSLPITFTGSNNYTVWYYEASASTGSCSYDTSSTQTNTGSTSTTQSGPALTLTGTSDAIFAFLKCLTTVSSVASPYTLDGNTGSGAANAHDLNTSSGAATSWTLGTASYATVGAIAFK